MSDNKENDEFVSYSITGKTSSRTDLAPLSQAVEQRGASSATITAYLNENRTDIGCVELDFTMADLRRRSDDELVALKKRYESVPGRKRLMDMVSLHVYQPPSVWSLF